jgi:dihydroxyacetone kinase
VVDGGGSGHYPAFAGYVGQGVAHGAAMGNLFASPSAQQVYAVARAADRGAGVLFCYGNYAGDVLHFRQAQDRLNDEGVAARTVTVTDDISSAPLDEMHKRRGIAGDVAVLTVAGTAQLLPRMGRARPLAEKSLGTPDAGAVSLALIVRAVGACTGPDRTATERVAR